MDRALDLISSHLVRTDGLKGGGHLDVGWKELSEDLGDGEVLVPDLDRVAALQEGGGGWEGGEEGGEEGFEAPGVVGGEEEEAFVGREGRVGGREDHGALSGGAEEERGEGLDGGVAGGRGEAEGEDVDGLVELCPVDSFFRGEGGGGGGRRRREEAGAGAGE